jgi:flagellar biosynthesis/type III secretory pathway chaperone
MNNETERLLEILEQELEAYEVLEGMIVKEREVLRHPDAENIEEVLGGKAQVVTRIHRLEGERRQLTVAIAASLGLEGENVRLLEMLREIPAPLAGRLKEVRDRLFAKATSVTQENEKNQIHIDELLFVVNGVVDTIRSAFAKPTCYGQRGKLNGGRVDGGEVLSQAV